MTARTDDEVPSLDFTLTMNGDTDADGKVGDTLRYTAIATNSGNVPLENVNVQDALVNTSGTDCASLPIDATCTSTVNYTIAQADVETGSVSNTATATATGVGAKTVTRQTVVDQVEDLELEQTTTAAGFDGTNESIPYSYKVTNTGTVTLSGTLEIDDDKIESDDITCPAVIGDGIAPGAFLTCTGSYTTTQDDVDAGKVTNEASASLGGATSGEDSVTVNWLAPQGSEPDLAVSSGEVNEDAGSFTFTVTLNPSSLQTVTVDYATTDVTATSGSDYTSASGTLTFSAGDTSKTVSVPVADDEVDESDETFTLTLSDAFNAGIPIPSGTATIKDDDTAGVTISETSLDIDEGDSDTYTVILDSQPTHSVIITVNDPSNTDVTAEPASLTFTPTNWGSAQTVTVTASHDGGHDDEDGTVTHTAASTDTKYDGISVSDVSVDVTDDDDVPVTVSFGSETHSVLEDESATITVTLSVDPERTVTIPITRTNQDGASDSDYSGVPSSVVFVSGETEKTFDFEAIHDEEEEDDESVKLTFGSLPAGVTEGATNETLLSILDIDGGREGSNKGIPEGHSVIVNFEQASFTVAEGSSVTVKVTLNEDPRGAVTIPLTKTDQGGVSSADYSGVPASVEFVSGDTEKTFSFSATQDTTDDDGESAKLGFGDLPDGVTEGATGETTVSITDDDVPSVTVSFEQASYTVAEGSSVTVTVTLDQDPERTVTIPLTKSNQGGATASDYSVPTSVVFNSGDTEKTFSFAAADDSDDDDGESVKLGFGTLTTGVSAGSVDESTISITDDDETTQNLVSVQASFQASTYSLTEGSTIDVIVTLSDDPERNVSIPLTATNGTGTTSSDYSGVPATVDFASGETEKSFTFTAEQDDIDEDSEELTLGFDTLPDGVSTGTTAQATVTIVDSIHVSFGTSYYQAYEGGNGAVVTVQLDNAPALETVIPITATGTYGATSADWTGVPDTLTFSSGETSKTFTVMAYDDTVEDDGERVQLSFGTLPQGVARGTPSTATVELMNMEVPQVNRNMCPSDAGERIILESVGEISQAGEADFWRVKLDLQRLYIIEVLGKDSGLDVMNRDTHPGDLTLEDPIIVAIWDDGRNIKRRTGPGGSDNGGTGRNSLDVGNGFTPSGWHEIEVQGKGGTGTYQIKVRVNNVCINVNGGETYPYFGGPDGFVLDTAGDVTTGKDLMTTYSMNWRSIPGYLGDNWSWYRENVPDVDWIRVHLKTNHEYTIELWTEDHYAAEYKATDLKILGIYDANGVQIPNTSSADSGEKVTLTYEPDTDGTYYVAVGSGERDRTGAYSLSVQGTPDPDFQKQVVNSPASGVPGIEGSPQTGQTLSSSTSGIQDQDGMSGAAFIYQWTRHDLGSTKDADIDGATGETYTVTAEDEGKALKVRVTFTDDAGNEESLTSSAVIVSPAPILDPEPANASATGAPGVEGSPTVGQSLTVTTSGVADDDGISAAVFAYQWLADDVEIDGANASTYTVVSGDIGKELRVRVTLTDDSGNGESLTSAATATVESAPNNPATGAPSIRGTPGGRDADGGHIGHLRRRRAERNDVQLPVGSQRRNG